MIYMDSISFKIFQSLVFGFIFIFTLLLVSDYPVSAHQPFTDDQISEAAQSESWETKRDFMADIDRRQKGNLEQREKLLLNIAEGRARNLSPTQLTRNIFGGPNFAFPTGTGPLGSRGNRNILTVMIDFPDTQGTIDRDRVSEAIVGTGGASASDYAPFDSVRSYYKRASQQKLDLGGEVKGWVRMDNNRSDYGGDPNDYLDHQRALLELFTEALSKIDDTTDFTQYDNDNDGDIDGLVVLYAGDPEGWGDFFWAYRWVFFIEEASNIRFDGKRLEQFVFQFVQTRPNGDYEPEVLLHEVGHLLGLNDYYDYCPKDRFLAGRCDPAVSHPGPDGGVGKFDMMDGNWGNHNAYSRWLLDWISPKIIGSGEHIIELRASGLDIPRETFNEPYDAIAIYPALSDFEDSSAPSSEMFIVEYRSKTGNDLRVPGDGGIVIWHIAATPNDAPLRSVFDNSYTTPKQIRLLRSNQPSDFLANGRMTSSDFFGIGNEFSPNSVPPSISHDGDHTGIRISDISYSGDTVRMKVAVESLSPTTVTAPLPSATNEPVVDDTSNLSAADDQQDEFTKLLALEREYTDLSANALGQLWAEFDEKDAKSLSEMDALKARMVLVKWAQKDGLSALRNFQGSNAGLKKFTFDVIDEALDAYVSASPLSAGNAFLKDDDATVRGLVEQSNSYGFVQKAFKARTHLSESTTVSEFKRIADQKAVFSAVNGLRSGGRSLDSLTAIAKDIDGGTGYVSSLISLERSIDELQLKSEFEFTQELRNQIMRSIKSRGGGEALDQ